MSGMAKDGDTMFKLVKDRILMIEDTWHATVTFVTTDDGPDCHKAWRLVTAWKSNIMSFACWAHKVRRAA